MRIVLIFLMLFVSNFAETEAEADEIQVGQYTQFAPVSSPDAKGRNLERSLLLAVQKASRRKLTFKFHEIPYWDNTEDARQNVANWLWKIWELASLKQNPAALRYGGPFQLVSGGITIVPEREGLVKFTHPFLRFRQSLLVGSKSTIQSHEQLTSLEKIGAVQNTTGETAFLERAKLVDQDHLLWPGTEIVFAKKPLQLDSIRWKWKLVSDSPMRIELVQGVLPGDAAIQNRLSLVPPRNKNLPRLVYYPRGEDEMLRALKNGDINGVARGEIGNRLAAEESAGQLKVVGLFSEERMGFAVDAGNDTVREQISRWTDLLTNNGRTGFQDFLDEPRIYDKRASAFLAVGEL